MTCTSDINCCKALLPLNCTRVVISRVQSNTSSQFRGLTRKCVTLYNVSPSVCMQAAVFEQLKSINPQLLRRLSERLHFVVNKADVKHVCEGMDGEATQEYVASLLNSQMSMESFQMQPSQVILMSARDAFLARMVLRGQPMEAADMAKFREIAFGRSSRKKKVCQARSSCAALPGA